MVLTHLVVHGLFFAVIVNGTLLLVMLTTSPRVWGYSDYEDFSHHYKAHVRAVGPLVLLCMLFAGLVCYL